MNNAKGKIFFGVSVIFVILITSYVLYSKFDFSHYINRIKYGTTIKFQNKEIEIKEQYSFIFERGRYAIRAKGDNSYLFVIFESKHSISKLLKGNVIFEKGSDELCDIYQYNVDVDKSEGYLIFFKNYGLYGQADKFSFPINNSCNIFING